MAQATAPASPGGAAGEHLDEQQLDTVVASLMQTMRVLKSAPLGTPVEGACLGVLHTVGSSGPLRPGDLASEVRLDASTVSRHLQVLERLGMVARERDADDRRAFRVATTPLGDSTLTEAAAVRRSLLSGALQGWSRADVTQLAQLLHRLAEDTSSAADSLHATRHIPGERS
ncbi:DNA-binding MarR family transcriptional regulator [Motilibacter peucedani]|uniref:DNA-binding MarR family transcriptional regulator n=1 Tax=Motilibacter peucedani TaxID=598650 RepID=A0A420XV58_9ACTN|nr:MarR family winged helix-turn-helix transcriptional regulator [Motilibacter peucedani]RKS80706.1 DNA-binding MarR family transcriptional regulator [Motilibacter peucedani]